MGLASLAAAFAIAWLVLAVYLVRLWAAQRSIARRIAEIEGH